VHLCGIRVALSPQVELVATSKTVSVDSGLIHKLIQVAFGVEVLVVSSITS
jgi:hypothetical protein